MATHLELRLLGPFLALKDGVPLEGFRSDKVRALLAYLVLEGRARPLRRSEISDLLWPGYTEETARHSLRTALHNLRRLLEPLDIVRATRQTLQLIASDQELWCDALELEFLLADLSPVSAPNRRLAPYQQVAARQGIALYHGEFMQGFALPDCPGFTDWQRAQRVRYGQQMAHVRSILQKQPTHASGNLPRSLTSFVGRRKELATIEKKVLDPAYPIISIVGEGGVGKTRLALAVAEHVSNAFADGAWYVSLSDLVAASPADAESSTDTAVLNDVLASTVIQVLAVADGEQGSPLQTLLRYVADKQLLLLLDNFEQFVDGADFVLQLARAGSHLKLLITSRRRCNLQAEYVFRLQGLSVPPAEGLAAGPALAACTSVELFLERADRAVAGFRPQPHE